MCARVPPLYVRIKFKFESQVLTRSEDIEFEGASAYGKDFVRTEVLLAGNVMRPVAGVASRTASHTRCNTCNRSHDVLQVLHLALHRVRSWAQGACDHEGLGFKVKGLGFRVWAWCCRVDQSVSTVSVSGLGSGLTTYEVLYGVPRDSCPNLNPQRATLNPKHLKGDPSKTEFTTIAHINPGGAADTPLGAQLANKICTHGPVRF
jgi:hypothetical protein